MEQIHVSDSKQLQQVTSGLLLSEKGRTTAWDHAIIFAIPTASRNRRLLSQITIAFALLPIFPTVLSRNHWPMRPSLLMGRRPNHLNRAFFLCANHMAT